MLEAKRPKHLHYAIKLSPQNQSTDQDLELSKRIRNYFEEVFWYGPGFKIFTIRRNLGIIQKNRKYLSY
jgi:hypothetical protein